MDPAYGKSKCLLALPTARIALIQLSESCLLQRCSACSVSFSLQCAPARSQRDRYTADVSGSSFKRKPFPNGTWSYSLSGCSSALQ